MNDVYIKAEDLNRWIIRYLPSNRDLYSIDELIGAIESFDDEIADKDREIDDLKEQINQLKGELAFYTKQKKNEV